MSFNPFTNTYNEIQTSYQELLIKYNFKLRIYKLYLFVTGPSIKDRQPPRNNYVLFVNRSVSNLFFFNLPLKESRILLCNQSDKVESFTQTKYKLRTKKNILSNFVFTVRNFKHNSDGIVTSKEAIVS